MRHIGKTIRGTFQPGAAVICKVDAERRKLMSRLHSAGHIVDMAVSDLRPSWIPGKGYHFSQGPYVEYAATLEGVDRDKLRADVEARCSAIVAGGAATTIRFMEKRDMGSVCRHVPDYIPEGKPARVVMYGDFGVPCGGTHVSNLADVGQITIRKIKSEGADTVRVAYDVAR